MPRFQCTVCGADFDVPQAALDRYEGWEPKYCRQHSPAKGAKKPAAAGAASPLKKRREQGLSRAEVLAKYRDGPATGVFTDGSATPNPGPGGWGVVWVEGGEIRAEAHGHEPDTTNNRMELQALIEAYTLLPEDTSVTVYTDSRLCVDTITRWAPAWERRGWKRKGGEIKNLDRVKRLLTLYRAHPDCPLRWIESHVGQRWNEYADSLATAWMRDEV